MRAVLASLCFLVSSSAADPLDDVRTTFTYDGSPIQPGIIAAFSNWLPDSPEPQILAIDLSSSQKSNRFDGGPLKPDGTGWIRARRGDAHDHEEFGYHYIGTLPSGTMVLHTYEDGGGSGIFESVMLLAISSEEAEAADGRKRRRDALRILRMVPIGDRARASISITGTSVLIDRMNAHDPDQRKPMALHDPQLPTAPLPAGR
jgi:hypothetical protein